jgi:hypothetical protein
MFLTKRTLEGIEKDEGRSFGKMKEEGRNAVVRLNFREKRGMGWQDGGAKEGSRGSDYNIRRQRWRLQSIFELMDN